MLKQYSLLSILFLAVLLAGCSSKAAAQAAEAKALQESTAIASPEETPEVPALADVVPHHPPPSCPITVPQGPPFVPPSPYDTLGFEGEFWYGSSSLWTAVPQDGTWAGLPYNQHGYAQKVFWWREGYVWNEEPEPALTITAERLDAPAPTFTSSKATNAYANDIGSAMLSGVGLPTLGCWKITGKYADAELSFVVWVAP